MSNSLINWRLYNLFKDHFKGQTPNEFKQFLKNEGFDILQNILVEKYGNMLGRSKLHYILMVNLINQYIAESD